MFNKFVTKILYKAKQGIIVRIRDLSDAVVSRRLVTLCVVPGARGRR